MSVYNLNKEELDALYDLQGAPLDFGYSIENEIVYEAIDVEPPEAGTVDVIIFGGQSNMVGQGTAAEAPDITTGAACWYADGAVSEMEKEGSLIPYFINMYYKYTKCPVVAIKAAWNGYSTSTYSGTVNATCEKIQSCIDHLTAIGKTVRRIMLVWNQGESDASNNATTAAYVSAFEGFKTKFKNAGVQMFYMVKIGQFKSGNIDYTNIRAAYDELCLAEDTVLVSDKFYGATAHMSDVWHYTQVVYNAVGKEAGKNTAYYYNKGERPIVTAWNEDTDFKL